MVVRSGSEADTCPNRMVGNEIQHVTDEALDQLALIAAASTNKPLDEHRYDLVDRQ
jgi:hypothetical protein